jgi:hypothetical protein
MMDLQCWLTQLVLICESYPSPNQDYDSSDHQTSQFGPSDLSVRTTYIEILRIIEVRSTSGGLYSIKHHHLIPESFNARNLNT